MTKPSSFQSIILKLQDFWALHGGTLITQPYYTQVGAGSVHAKVVRWQGVKESGRK